MPVRINLKELFGSDSQEITVDKLNFNFNKLLELGVGLKGERGLTGPQGPAGPIGPIGPQGDKGNYWFVGTGDPNGLALDPADEDFYIDTDSSQIWQYDIDTDSWSILIDLEGVVNDYLIVNGSPFVRGFGSSSPQDSRYITFTTRGGTAIDQSGDSKGSGSTNNDILFLNNFDESSGVLAITSDLSDTNSTYTALQKIAVDITPGGAERYGLEVGSLYPIGASGIELSDFNQSLKLHHIVEDITGSQINEPDLNINNSAIDVLSRGIISISGHHRNINQNPDNDYLSILDLQSPRRDALSGTNSIFHTKIGSKFSMIQDASWIRYDGVLFETLSAQAGIGIAYDFEISGKDPDFNYLMLDHGSNVESILLNNKTYQDHGDIIQLGTGELDLIDIELEGYGSTVLDHDKRSYGNGSLISSGNLMFTIESRSSDGDDNFKEGILGSPGGIRSKLYLTDISSNFNPIHMINTYGYEVPTVGFPFPGEYIVGWGITDSDLLGDHLIIINDVDERTYSDPSIGSTTGRVNFQILNVNIDGTNSSFDRKGFIQDDIDLYSAHRVKTFGTKAIVTTNRLKHWDNLGTVSNAPNSNYNDTCKIVLVDVSDINSPFIENAIKQLDRNHYLDIFKMSSGLFAIPSIKLGDPDVTDTYFEDCELMLNIVKVEGSNMSIDSINLSNISSIQRSNYEDPTVWSPFATVVARDGLIYVMHRNTIYICTHTESGIDVRLTYNYDQDQDIRALDSKLVGDNIYILAGIGGTNHWLPEDSKIIKLDVRDIDNPKVISSTLTGEKSSTKLEIVGETLYINKVARSGGYFIPFKLDSFKTDSAQIGSLKVSNVNISQDLNVEGVVNINRGITIGEGGILTVGNAAVFDLHTSGDAVISETLTVENIPNGDITDSGTNILVANSTGTVQKVTPESIVEESGAGVPCGVIVMWSGSASSIPSGWYLCDGNNGTPDLTDRFIVGAGGEYSPGDTGGSKEVTLDSSQSALPQHRHFVDQVSGTTDGSRAKLSTATSNSNSSSDDGRVRIRANNNLTSSDTRQQNDHTHTFTVPSHWTVNTEIEEADFPHENRPPYFALCFIMKCQGSGSIQIGNQNSGQNSSQSA